MRVRSSEAQQRERERKRQYDQRRKRPARICPVCGRQYHPTVHRQRTCSRTCVREGQIRRRIWPASKLAYRNCAECGRLFIARGAGLCCSEGCSREARLRYDREYNQRVRPAPPRACNCGVALTGRQKKCGVCVKRADRERKRRERTSAAGRLAKQRENRRRKAARRGVVHEEYTTAEIAERDGYRCGLCHELVAMTKVVPHPKAPTIDHIIPLDDRGDDVKSNVQLAHFLCNSIKGNRGSQQLKLLG